MSSPRQKSNNKGQATTELAILGSVVLLLLSYLMQQGFLYNSRQAMEMYAFRKALKLSQQYEKGISLTVMRDVITPSFFSGLNRQRLTAAASVEQNPWMLWLPNEGEPEHIASRQLVQIGDAMIRVESKSGADAGAFIEVPPTLVQVTNSDATGPDANKPQWRGSVISEMDSQSTDNLPHIKQNISTYTNRTETKEDLSKKSIQRDLKTEDNMPMPVKFERDTAKMKQDIERDDWEGKTTVGSIQHIPSDANFIIEETLKRSKNVETPHR